MGSIAADALARLERQQAQPKTAPKKDEGRNGRTYNQWDRELEKRLIKLYNDGLTNTELGMRLGKTANAVGIKLNRMRNAGLIEARPKDDEW